MKEWCKNGGVFSCSLMRCVSTDSERCFSTHELRRMKWNGLLYLFSFLCSVLLAIVFEVLFINDEDY